MSKYGPAWVWFATGQSLGQATPSSTLHRRDCQPQSAPSIHATPAVLPSSATGNWSGAGTRAESTQRKGGHGKLWGLLNQECAPKCSRAASLMEGGYKAPAAGTKHTGHLTHYVT